MVDEGYIYYRVKLHNLRDTHIQRINELSGVRRFLYNWGLNYCEEQKNKGHGVPNFHTFCKRLTELRNTSEFAWLREYNVTSERYAFKDLVQAFRKFFNGENRYPVRKTKRVEPIMCSIREDRIKFNHDNKRYAYLPGVSESLTDWIDLGNHNIPVGPFNYDNVRIKFDSIDYWLSLSVKHRNPFTFNGNPSYQDGCIGVDVGIRTTATLSDGTAFDPPNRHRLNVLMKRRIKQNRKVLSGIHRHKAQATRAKAKPEDIPYPKNQQKRLAAFKKTCNRIHNIITYHNHCVSRAIANKNAKIVVVETLSVMRMEQQMKIKQIVPYIHSASLNQLVQFIDYKCRDAGTKVVYAPAGYKSSQICSVCGMVTKPGPSKIYTCPYCGLVIDRDLNAAYNLRDYGMSIYH